MSHLNSIEKGVINDLIAKAFVLAHDAAVIKTEEKPIDVVVQYFGHTNEFTLRVVVCSDYENDEQVALMNDTVYLKNEDAVTRLSDSIEKLVSLLWDNMLPKVGADHG